MASQAIATALMPSPMAEALYPAKRVANDRDRSGAYMCGCEGLCGGEPGEEPILATVYIESTATGAGRIAGQIPGPRLRAWRDYGSWAWPTQNSRSPRSTGPSYSGRISFGTVGAARTSVGVSSGLPPVAVEAVVAIQG